MTVMYKKIRISIFRAVLTEIENQKSEVLLLPDQDSNLDKRYQKPLYYHYTIRQSPLVCYPSRKGMQI
jgi:hypothetical protein